MYKKKAYICSKFNVYYLLGCIKVKIKNPIVSIAMPSLNAIAIVLRDITVIVLVQPVYGLL